MKKIKLLLTLFVVSICAVQSAWARTAPAMPASQTLESGKTYYLYNVGSDRFLTQSYATSQYLEMFTDKGSAVKISLVNETQYTIQFVESQYYIASYDNDGNLRAWASNGGTSSYYFTFTSCGNGYRIQNVGFNKGTESTYFGINSNNEVKNGVTESENIEWQLLDTEEAARFIAKRNLYRALESAEGYAVDKYETIYNNNASSNEALQEAANILNKAIDASNTIQIPGWSDYKILFEMSSANPWYYGSTWYGLSNFHSPNMADGSSIYLNASIETDEYATLVFTYNNNSLTYRYDGEGMLELYLDNELKQTINFYQGKESNRYFLEMAPGKHEITWKFTNSATTIDACSIGDIGIEKTPTIVVSLLEPGSLGTEVLAKTDHIQNVRKLIISGEMNDDDWARILMMTSIFSLDLKDAIVTDIPAEQLSRNSHGSELSFLHEVKLPNTLKTIGNGAFSGTYLDEITFPEGLTSIGEYAFRDTRIKEALIPETVTSVGEYAFSDNQCLTNASYPAAAKEILQACFSDCNVLQPFDIPEGIVTVDREAFNKCHSFSSLFPSTLTKIGYRAFYGSAIENIKINEGTIIDDEAFAYSKAKNIEFPTTMYEEVWLLFYFCDNLSNIYFKSPTMVISKYGHMFDGSNASADLTIHVPSYLVSDYKQDSFWYNYKIEGFSTADVTDWIIAQPLKMSTGQRFEGTPNVKVQEAGRWEITGDDAMTLGNFQTEQLNDYYYGQIVDKSSIILSGCKNISITGDYTHRIYTTENRWYFLTLPFDTKVGDISCPASYAVRYYDGANRAENGTGGNWKNYSGDDIIPAGTGFIFQTSQNCWTTFKAQDNASKQYVFSNKLFTKSLQVNASEQKEHKGWNLVGNPWMTYYNIHKLNFTAPITCWNVYNQNYTAYSVIDDDYAILPNEAFFVQCPGEELPTIEFPIDGRQLTNVIESQNGARAWEDAATTERKLIDIELTDGESTDKTRFVLNPQAMMDYEMTCDASKFFSMNVAVPQIYTVENGVSMAINERPMGDGTVQIGIKVAADGTYTISSPRNQFASIILLDKQTNTETDLTNASYTFSTDAGTIENRFELRAFGSTTGIQAIENGALKTADVIYDLNGRRVENPTKGVYIINGKKVVVK